MLENSLVKQFVDAVVASAHTPYEPVDETYLVNRVLAKVGDGALEVQPVAGELLDVVDALVDEAVKNGLCEDNQPARAILNAQLFDLVTPLPSVVNQQFWATYEHDPQKAIADFYKLSRENNYIQTRAIAKNIGYPVRTKYGDLEITINLSKPEKDPKAIAAAKQKAQTGYPTCQLCMQNEGYKGRGDYPARANHRIIRLKLGQEDWGFQYSPYAYFNEHCIFLDQKHEPMEISRTTFDRLAQIVAKFPGYFAGSNADLPIVGGSILTHEHYQGGRHTFAMEKAPLQTKLAFTDYPEVTAGIVKWPMSVIRLRSANQTRVVDLAAKILDKWRGYSDESVDVRAKTGDTPHHTITPIARMHDGQFELDLVLRDNQTSPKYPDGIFHPHKDVQHIKKENIGLIEVMGLAILPPRLKDELQEVAKFVAGQPAKVADYHLDWAEELKEEHAGLDFESALRVVKESVGHIFARVLEDAGVFKQTEAGHAAFMRFVETLGAHAE